MGIFSYGRTHYRKVSGREGDWIYIAQPSNAVYISLHALAYGLEAYRSTLPKAKLGKERIRFKNLDDIDLNVAEKIVRARRHIGGSGHDTGRRGQPLARQ